MTDLTFSITVLILGWVFYRFVQRPSFSWAGLTGALLALTALARPIGLYVMLLGYLTMAWLLLRRRIRLSMIAVSAVLFVGVLAPRLYWTQQTYGKPFLANQNGAIIAAIAGAVEFYGQSMNFTQAENAWIAKHASDDRRAALQALIARPGVFAFLTAKGIARVLVGHMNIEWIYALTGKAMQGPGWFKEGGTGGEFWQKNGLARCAWLMGVLLTAFYCLAFYLFLGWQLIRSAFWRTQNAPVIAWLLASSAVLAIMPLLLGDARFRAPIFALLVVTGAILPLRTKGEA